MKDKEYKETLSKFSHEVRNPVTLINSFLQLMVQEHPEIATYEHYDKIQENITILRALLDELTNYNHSTTLHTESINIYFYLQDYLETAHKLLDALDIKIYVKKLTAIPPVQIDPIKLNQILNNLVLNARDAIVPDTGRVTFELGCDGYEVTLKVRDTGCGMDPKSIESMFQPFVTTKQDGTGLGLPICEEIMKAHGGSISAVSVPEDGTEITLHFPIS